MAVTADWLDLFAEEIRRVRGEVAHLKETTDFLARKVELVEEKIRKQEADRDHASDPQISYLQDLRRARGLQPLEEGKLRSLTKAEADRAIKELLRTR